MADARGEMNERMYTKTGWRVRHGRLTGMAETMNSGMKTSK